jgi:hypothetical protein
MVAGAGRLGLPEPVTGLVLPLAVATFKIAAPLTALTVALTLAHLHGVEVGPAQLVLAGLLAVISTLAVVGLPGQVSFFAGQRAGRDRARGADRVPADPACDRYRAGHDPHGGERHLPT